MQPSPSQGAPPCPNLADSSSSRLHRCGFPPAGIPGPQSESVTLSERSPGTPSFLYCGVHSHTRNCLVASLIHSPGSGHQAASALAAFAHLCPQQVAQGGLSGSLISEGRGWMRSRAQRLGERSQGRQTWAQVTAL